MKLLFSQKTKQHGDEAFLDDKKESELQKSHGYAGIAREEGLQNGQSVRKVSCQHTT